MTDIERLKDYKTAIEKAYKNDIEATSDIKDRNALKKLYLERIQTFENAISALEKQIPKKPIKQIWVDDEKHKGDVRLATKDDVLTKYNHGSINLCPNCKEWVMRYKYLSPPKDRDYYCKCCGQALDWGEGE